MTFPCTLVVRVSAYNDQFRPVGDNSNVKVTLEGTNPEASQMTDTSGYCVFHDLSIGNYDLLYSKDGYGINEEKSVFVAGKNGIDTTGDFIFQKCQTKINSYDISISRNHLFFSGSISSDFHILDTTDYPYEWPSLALYLSDSANVSSTNFKQAYNFYSNRKDKNKFQDSVYIFSSLFPSGKRLYCALSGQNSFKYRLFDYQSLNLYDPCIGILSEIKSIIVP